MCLRSCRVATVPNALDRNDRIKPNPVCMLHCAVPLQMEGWKGFGTKKVQNMLIAIDKSKKQPPHVLLSGLGIPAVGQHISKLLLKHCNNSIMVCFRTGQGSSRLPCVARLRVSCPSLMGGLGRGPRLHACKGAPAVCSPGRPSTLACAGAVDETR